MNPSIHLSALCFLVATVMAVSAPAFSQDEIDPLEEILGITEKEEKDRPAPVVSTPQVTTVTATNEHFQVQLALPPVYQLTEDAVRVQATRIDDGTAERYLLVKVSLYYGPEYYTWENYETLRMNAGDEVRTEIAYNIRKIDDYSLVRVTLADLTDQYVEFPPQNIFFVAALRPGEEGMVVETWRPETHEAPPFVFHYTPGLLKEGELSKLTERYMEAQAKLENIWKELPRPRTSVYLFEEQESRNTFILHDDELTQYPDAIMDERGEDGEWADPAEKLSWVSSIYLGDPPPLFHHALALILQEDPQVDGRPLDEYLRAQEEEGNLHRLQELLRYDSMDPEDATRTVGIPQLASVVQFLLQQKDPDAFREAFILMMRGDWVAHNEGVLQGIYGMDLETMEREWLHSLGIERRASPVEIPDSPEAGGSGVVSATGAE